MTERQKEKSLKEQDSPHTEECCRLLLDMPDIPEWRGQEVMLC